MARTRLDHQDEEMRLLEEILAEIEEIRKTLGAKPSSKDSSSLPGQLTGVLKQVLSGDMEGLVSSGADLLSGLPGELLEMAPEIMEMLPMLLGLL